MLVSMNVFLGSLRADYYSRTTLPRIRIKSPPPLPTPHLPREEGGRRRRRKRRRRDGLLRPAKLRRQEALPAASQQRFGDHSLLPPRVALAAVLVGARAREVRLRGDDEVVPRVRVDPQTRTTIGRRRNKATSLVHTYRADQWTSF
jgi:hypothetical protein